MRGKMKPIWLMITCASLLLLASADAFGVKSQTPSEVPIQHAEKRGANYEILTFIAGTFCVPLVAEIVADHTTIDLPAGTHTPEDAIRLAIATMPDVAFSFDNGVFHVYDNRLVNAPGNMLGYTFKSFKIPPSVAQLKLSLRSRLNTAKEGYASEGGVASELMTPELTSQSLTPMTLTDVAARTVLQTAAKSGTFYTIIIFPNASPTADDWPYSSQHWIWGSIKRSCTSSTSAPSPSLLK